MKRRARRALWDHPPGVDQPELYRQRSGAVILPRDANWWDATEELRTSFVAVTSAEAVPSATAD